MACHFPCPHCGLPGLRHPGLCLLGPGLGTIPAFLGCFLLALCRPPCQELCTPYSLHELTHTPQTWLQAPPSPCSESGRCCLAVTGLGLAWTEYEVTICLNSCLAVSLHPFGEVLLKYERSESRCDGSSGSNSGPPRVTTMERSPASREVGTGLTAPGRRQLESQSAPQI